MHGAQQYPKQPRNFASRVLKNIFNRNEGKMLLYNSYFISTYNFPYHYSNQTRYFATYFGRFQSFFGKFFFKTRQKPQEIIQRVTNDALFLD